MHSQGLSIDAVGERVSESLAEVYGSMRELQRDAEESGQIKGARMATCFVLSALIEITQT